MTNIEHFSCEYVESHNKDSYRTSLHINLLGWHLQRLMAWLETRSGCVFLISMAFERKWQSLIAWFSIPSWIHPRKNYMAIKAQRRLLYMNYWYSGCSRLTIQHSANTSCCIAISTAPLIPLIHVQHWSLRALTIAYIHESLFRCRQALAIPVLLSRKKEVDFWWGRATFDERSECIYVYVCVVGDVVM